MRKWSTFEGRADPGTWLYAIAARFAKRRFRKRGDGSTKRSKLKSFSELTPMKDDSVIDLAIDRRQPADPLMRAEARAMVQTAILALPPQYRVPLVMKDILELPLEECAQALGLKLDTVKTRIHRARPNLSTTASFVSICSAPSWRRWTLGARFPSGAM